jgi:NTP pyrophosphatase (non-canonical NTP hydrolase)|tara:strand:- start:460 stop:807 length:348 start_codon:yes stop_codon:yes gene_type:complete
MNTGETQALIEDVNNIKRWHHDRNLIDGSDDKSQFAKLIQEAGELSDNICKGKDISDDIGDMIVVLINIAERNDLSLTECVRQAWDDIKDRKGQMRDGVFIKEEDLIKESLGIKT